MKVSDFDFSLPSKLIADKPLNERDMSRLLVLDRNTNKVNHYHFKDITKLLKKTDVLVFNNTKVFPARLIGKRKDTGGKVEILLNQQNDEGNWEVIGKNLNTGTIISFEKSRLEGKVLSKHSEIAQISFNIKGELFFSEINQIGLIPLPPYIEAKRKLVHTKYDNDRARYQTVYAKEIGSVAAPTAGLHFTHDLLTQIRDLGVETIEVTLHVGLGTFAPVKTEKVEDHQIHKEAYYISVENYNDLIKMKTQGRRIIAVGTTTTRVLESVFQNYPHMNSLDNDLSGSTNIYIYPGYKFKFVDGLITNFHLPKSSLLFLVSAFTDREEILKAYNEAIMHNYRFYSYGDAMFIK